MECMNCGAGAAESANYCAACGHALGTACAACGAASPKAAHFCGACGAPLIAARPAEAALRPTRSAREQEELRLLEKCHLFRALDEHTRHQLASRARHYRFASGEVIFQIGSPGQSMMAVVSGTLRITAQSAAGREIALAELGPGEVFGEIALLDGGGRTASAIALSCCELLVLERRDVLPFLETHPNACVKLLETVCERLRHADEWLTEIAFSDLSVRLAKLLLRKAIRPPSGSDPAQGPKLGLSQRELATLIGGTRESVNRCLRDWHGRGIVHLRGGWIVIDTPAALEEIAELD